MLPFRARWVVGSCCAFAAAACVAPGPSWRARQAEQLYAEGRLDAALELSEREIAWSGTSPGPSHVDLHASILRDLGRHSEADALIAFGERYFAGEDTNRPDEHLRRLQCNDRQPGYDLIRSFGKPEQGAWEIGPVVATFEIDERGSIGAIRVLSARDPASAWAAIDAVASAGVRAEKLAKRRAGDPGGFPVALCFYRDFDPYQPGYPDEGRIRGMD